MLILTVNIVCSNIKVNVNVNVDNTNSNSSNINIRAPERVEACMTAAAGFCCS